MVHGIWYVVYGKRNSSLLSTCVFPQSSSVATSSTHNFPKKSYDFLLLVFFGFTITIISVFRTF